MIRATRHFVSITGKVPTNIRMAPPIRKPMFSMLHEHGAASIALRVRSRITTITQLLLGRGAFSTFRVFYGSFQNIPRRAAGNSSHSGCCYINCFGNLPVGAGFSRGMIAIFDRVLHALNAGVFAGPNCLGPKALNHQNCITTGKFAGQVAYLWPCRYFVFCL